MKTTPEISDAVLEEAKRLAAEEGTTLIVTHPRVYDPPSPTDAALAQVAAWLDSPTLVPLGESHGYRPHLDGEVRRAQVTGPRVHDARVAASCRFHRVRELWSADRDFGRFAGLVVRNPLVG